MHHIDLQYFLDLDLPFYEPRNERRGGWSGVSRVHCAGQTVFIKRQVNHTCRDIRAAFFRIPTLRREFRNYGRLARIGIETPELLLYAEAKSSAMMVVSELRDYRDLDSTLTGTPDPDRRQSILSALLAVMLTLHDAGYRHGSLYGKHIMVRSGSTPRIALIDLEKLRYSFNRKAGVVRDISQLLRHTTSLTDEEREGIIACYEARFPGFRKSLERRSRKKS